MPIFRHAGKTWDDDESIDFDLYKSVGAGIRWYSPLGPLRLEGETELALDERTIADDLQERQEIQLVSFKVSEQEFVLPIDCVQEVVTYVEPTKLPSASRFIAGIANLRGRVTPLIRLDRLLGKENADMNFKFIVVCRFNELQVGLIIHSIATIYRMADCTGASCPAGDYLDRRIVPSLCQYL